MPIPVLPAVPSTIVPPDSSFFLLSASLIIYRAATIYNILFSPNVLKLKTNKGWFLWADIQYANCLRFI